MIGLLLWLLLAPLLCLADAALASSWTPLQVGVAIGLVLALWSRPAALPGLLLGAALGRAMFEDGDLALHFLALAVPVAVLLPARLVFYKNSWLVQAVVAALIAIGVPMLTALLGGLSGQAVAPVDAGVGDACWAMVTAPPLAWLLRSVPPLSMFLEQSA